jgi:lipid-binding SYLF domain-containing protein
MAKQKICFRLTKSNWLAGMLTAALFMVPLLAAAADSSENERLTNAGVVLKELINSPEGIPPSVLNKSECVIVLPSVKKGGFIIGAQYGKGAMSCRTGAEHNGPWSAPIMMQSSGGSIGFQAGGQATDFVVLVMNDKGAAAVMKGRAKLGADASVAAGPVGRDAEASTTATMQAEMLSYSRSAGVFAGVSLNGTSLGPDDGANEKVYGKKISGEEIFNGAQTPDAGKQLVATLEEKSPKNISKGK